MVTRSHALHAADQTLSDDQGRFAAYLPAPGVLVTEVTGYLAHEFALALVAHLETITRSGQLALQFHDWFGVTGYDIRAQRDLTAWHAKHRAKVERLDIGVRSPMLRMGVTVANVPLRGLIRLHDEEQAFDRAAHDAVLARRSPSLAPARLPHRS